MDYKGVIVAIDEQVRKLKHARRVLAGLSSKKLDGNAGSVQRVAGASR